MKQYLLDKFADASIKTIIIELSIFMILLSLFIGGHTFLVSQIQFFDFTELIIGLILIGSFIIILLVGFIYLVHKYHEYEIQQMVNKLKGLPNYEIIRWEK